MNIFPGFKGLQIALSRRKMIRKDPAPAVTEDLYFKI